MAKPKPFSLVIVAEDDSLLRKAICGQLKSLGLTNILEAGEGNKALALLKQFRGPRNLLVTDLNMMRGMDPDHPIASIPMDGDILIPKALELDKNLEIILHCSQRIWDPTAPTTIESIDSMVRSGQINFLPKPTCFSGWKEAIENLLSR